MGVTPTAAPLRPPSGQGGTPEAFGARVAGSLVELGGQTAALGVYIREQDQQKMRFDALTKFTQFQHDQKQKLIDAQRNTTPGGNDLYAIAAENFRRDEAAFLESLPQEFQDEFRARSAEVGASLSLEAAKLQFAANDDYFKQGLQAAFDQSRMEVSQDPEALETQRQVIMEKLEASGISDAEKVALGRKINAGLESVAYREAQIARLRAEAKGEGTDLDRAMQGLTEQGMPEGEALANIVGAQSALSNELGQLWSDLPTRVRAVLLEATVTDGLNKEVVDAIREGDLGGIADALRKSGAETYGDLIENPEAGIDNNPAFANVPYEDRLSLIADAERTVAAEVQQQAAAESAQNKSMVNALHVALYDGTAGQAEIDQMREAGILTDYDDIKKADDILAKRDEDLRLRMIGQSIMNGTQVYRPGDEEHKKVLDAMIGDQGLKALQQRNSDYAATSLLPLIEKAQATPSTVVEQLSGMARSMDSAKAYWALDLMGQIERLAPRALDQFSEEDRRNLAFWQTRKDYLTEEEMVKAIRGPVDPAERNARIALRKVGDEMFTKQEGALRNFDAVSLIPGPGLFGMGANRPTTKWVSQQLNTDFRNLFLDNYEMYGDVRLAKEAAAKQLLNVWGTTSVGRDGAIMKYPPERAYPPVAGNHAWLENQLIEEGLIEPGRQYELLSDAQTEAEWGQTAPSYILVRIKDGVSEPVMRTPPEGINEIGGPDERQGQGYGLPLRVYFDFRDSEAEAEQAWRDEQKYQQELNDQNMVVQRGMNYELEEGVAVPDDIFQDFFQKATQ